MIFHMIFHMLFHILELAEEKCSGNNHKIIPADDLSAIKQSIPKVEQHNKHMHLYDVPQEISRSGFVCLTAVTQFSIVLQHPSV